MTKVEPSNENNPETSPAISQEGWRRHAFRLLPWLILALSLSITWWSWRTALIATHRAEQAHFDLRVRETIERIEQRMHAYEQVLRGVKGLYEASDNVARDEFKSYVDSQRLPENFPGIQGVGFSLVVPAAERDEHVASLRKQGFSGYAIRPDGVRDTYSSIIYLEPFAGRNIRAFGFDMYSEPVRRAAMDQARDSGETSMSGKVRLIQESDGKEQAGFLMYLPIYRNGAPHFTVAERQQNLIGWAFAPFRINDLMEGIQGKRIDDLEFDIYDGTQVMEGALMFESHGNLVEETRYPDAFRTSVAINIASHPWTVGLRALPGLFSRLEQNLPLLIGVTGIAMSLLLSSLAWLLVTGRERALAKAREMNHELIETEARLRSQRQRLAEVIWGTNIGTWEWNIQTGETSVNERWAEIAGYTLKELEPVSIETWSKLAHPDDLRRSSELLARCFKREVDSYVCEIRMRHRLGHWIWVLDRGRIVEWADNGKPLRMSGTHQDITARKDAEARLQLAANVFTHAREAIMITDANACIVEVNDTFTVVTGYGHDEVMGKNPRMFKSGRQSEEFYAAFWQQLIATGHWSGEIWNQRKDGSDFPELLTISAVKDDSGKTQNYVALFSDITQIKEHQQQLERIAHYDSLTKLPNRVLLADRLEHAIAQSQRRGESLAVIYLDLDGFKAVNDTCGHDVGDELLIAVSLRMKEALRDGDTLARIGGDEFVAVLVDLGQPGDWEMILGRLLQAAADPVVVRHHRLHVSASIGVTIYPQDNVDADLLLRHADQAMYQAKQSGKNRYCRFDVAAQAASQYSN